MDGWERYLKATADLEPPFALLDTGAFWANAADMQRRAGTTPIRLASKSVRCRELQRRVLERDGFSGILAFTLPEALWLADEGFDDILVGYPTADRAALAELARRSDDSPGLKITVMIDSVEQLDLMDLAKWDRSHPLRVCVDIDAGLELFGGRVHLGAKRSPIHDVEAATSLAQEVIKRDGFTLVGLMAYEAQIAGVGNDVPGNPVKSAAVRAMQGRSAAELRDRRSAIVAAVRDLCDLEFVNGGGTGSIESTASEPAVTEIGAGSGLYAPHLFDNYTNFTLQPAAMFCLSVVRKPSPDSATVLGGGYLASGSADRLRLPKPYLPHGLKLDGQEGAGEVQTPLLGSAAGDLKVGDRVFFRHAKAGELCERFDRLHLVEGDSVVETLPTYRGEGKTFL